MVSLIEVNEENWIEFAKLSVDESQKMYLANNVGIIARGYVFRDCCAKVWGIADDGVAVGLALVRDLDEEPATYDLQQFMIDSKHQKKGYGSMALRLILSKLEKEHKYDCVEVCVKKDDVAAIHVYEKVGFKDSGYIDEDAPDFLNFVYRFEGENKKESYNQRENSGEFCVTKEMDPVEKQRISRTILEALPEWFGLPESREEYIEDSKDNPFFVAYSGSKQIGFICLKETGKDTAELYVMGVLKEYHRNGIGRMLFESAKAEAKRLGYSFLQVKTVQMGRYEEYDRTNRFYLSLGFKELEVFKTLWDEWNPCQVYVMAL